MRIGFRPSSSCERSRYEFRPARKRRGVSFRVNARAKLGPDGPPVTSEGSKVVVKQMKDLLSMQDGVEVAERAVESNLSETLLTGLLIGATTGVGVCMFEWLEEATGHALFHDLLPLLSPATGGVDEAKLMVGYNASLPLPTGDLWPLGLFPFAGALFVSLVRLVVPEFAPPSKAIASEPSKSRQVTPVKAAARASCAAVTLGSGNSLGPEGPVVELGAQVGVIVGRGLGYRGGDLKTMLSVGAAAGLAAGFNAPISAIFFAIETLLKRTDDRNTLPALLLASVTAGLVKDLLIGLHPKFDLPDFSLHGVVELPFLTLLGAAAGVSTVAFQRIFKACGDTLNQDSTSTGLAKPFIGSAAVAVVSLFFPQTLYLGAGPVNSVLAQDPLGGSWEHVAYWLELAGAKMVTTSVAAASGLVGGVFAPCLFVGSMIGRAFHDGVLLISPEASSIISEPAIYGVLGMASVLGPFGGIPLTSILLVYEITNDDKVLVPAAFAVGMSLFAQRVVLDTLEGEIIAVPSTKTGLLGPTISPRIMDQLQSEGLTAQDLLSRKSAVRVPSSMSLVKVGSLMTNVGAELVVIRRKVPGIKDADGPVVGAASLNEVSSAIEELNARLKRTYDALSDADGSVTTSSLCTYLRSQGANVSEDAVQAVVDTLDLDKNGVVDYREFSAGSKALGVAGTAMTVEESLLARGALVVPRDLPIADLVARFDSTGASCAAVSAGSLDGTGDEIVSAVGVVEAWSIRERCSIENLERNLNSLTSPGGS